MKKFILAALLYVSVIVVLAFETVGLLSVYKLHGWNILGGFFVICLPLAYIVALAIEGLLGLE